jgi:hypothetical protein
MKDLTTLSGDALVEALALDVEASDDATIEAAVAEQRKAGDVIFALSAPSIAQVKDAVAINASVKTLEAALDARKAEVEKAAAEFAAARSEFATDAKAKAKEKADKEAKEKEAEKGKKGKPFSNDDTIVEVPPVEQVAEVTPGETVEPGTEVQTETEPGEGEGGGEALTASGAKAAVAAGNARPVRLADKPVVITASGENLGVPMGERLDDHTAVAKAFIKKADSFPHFSLQSGMARLEATGGMQDMKKFDLAKFGVNFPDSLVAGGGATGEHNAVRNALAEHTKALTASLNMAKDGGKSLKEALTAAGWCAPSEPVYSYIADYVVDGLLTVPQVNAPRGGLLTTTGPVRSSQGAALDEFGFVQTEAQAIANTVKPLEGIDCPTFVDNRLDAIGYGFTIPFLTQKAYPELIADTLKFAGVLWAHKMNRRRINQILALSDAKTFEGYGPSVTDSLEVLSLVALNERRKWNIGRNAIMEVKLPAIALEVFRADMSRRSGLALDDVATEQKINAHFAARGLAVEYLSDWAEISYGSEIVLPGSFPAVMYPTGTFVEAVEDVVNLSAIYDAASVTVNQYTGVFFEQGQMLIKVGYGATKLTIPVNTAGESGALTLTGPGDKRENGSF